MMPANRLRDAVCFTIVRVARQHMSDDEAAVASALAKAADRGDDTARHQLLQFSEGVIARERRRRSKRGGKVA